MTLEELEKLIESNACYAYHEPCQMDDDVRKALPKLIAVAKAARSVRFEAGGPATVLEERLDDALAALEAP